jgi:hypothetical protein
MSEQYKAQKTISAIFREEEQVDTVIRRLLYQDVPRDRISAIGKKFQSQDRVSGFIPKRNLTLESFGKGEIFNSLFRPCFNLLTDIGIQHISCVGSVVIAGPISAVLLDTSSDTASQGGRSGLVSTLAALGTPEGKAELYQNRLETGEYLVMVEVPAARSAVFQLIMEGSGGENMHVNDRALSQLCSVLPNQPENFPSRIYAHFSEEAQSNFIKHYNVALHEMGTEIQTDHAFKNAMEQHYIKDANCIESITKVNI